MIINTSSSIFGSIVSKHTFSVNCATIVAKLKKMDRTMYGKVEPGTYQPYRCTRKQLPSPGCKINNNNHNSKN